MVEQDLCWCLCFHICALACLKAGAAWCSGCGRGGKGVPLNGRWVKKKKKKKKKKTSESKRERETALQLFSWVTDLRLPANDSTIAKCAWHARLSSQTRDSRRAHVHFHQAQLVPRALQQPPCAALIMGQNFTTKQRATLPRRTRRLHRLSESQMTKEMTTRKESEWWTQHVQAEVGPKEVSDTRKVAANKPCAAQNCQTLHGETGLHGSVEVHSARENLWRCQEN